MLPWSSSGRRKKLVEGLLMNPSPQCARSRPQAPRGNMVLKLLAVFLVAMAALLSRVLTTQQPAAAAPPKPSPVPPPAIGAVHPRISSSGKEIVFSYQGSIWRLPIQGGTMRRLSTGPGFAFEPCWSPDGGRVAYFQG